MHDCADTINVCAAGRVDVCDVAGDRRVLAFNVPSFCLSHTVTNPHVVRKSHRCKTFIMVALVLLVALSLVGASMAEMAECPRTIEDCKANIGEFTLFFAPHDFQNLFQ